MRDSSKQDNRPAFQFYYKDYIFDLQGLCSLGAIGLWTLMLCRMWASPKRGMLLQANGSKFSSKTLAKLTGEEVEVIEKYIKELEGLRTFDYVDGVITCRRMYKEWDIEQKRKESGRLGGLGISKDESKIISKIKQTAEEEEEVLVSNISIKKNKEKLFNKIWLKYPNKDGKKEALNHFVASINSKDDWEKIKIALPNYLHSDRVKNGYIKNGSTWFNNWKDWVDFKGVKNFIEPLPEPKPENPEEKAKREKQKKEESEARYQEMIEGFRKQPLQQLKNAVAMVRKATKTPPPQIMLDIIKEKEKNGGER